MVQLQPLHLVLRERPLTIDAAQAIVLDLGAILVRYGANNDLLSQKLMGAGQTFPAFYDFFYLLYNSVSFIFSIFDIRRVYRLSLVIVVLNLSYPKTVMDHVLYFNRKKLVFKWIGTL